MTQQLYLKSPRRAIPVTVEFTQTGLKFWTDQSPVFEITSEVPAAAASQLPKEWQQILALSPLDVLHYFQRSKVLAVYAGDLQEQFARLGLIAPETRYNSPDFNLQLQQDLQAVEHLSAPTQADIAEVLFKDRTKTGGSYRRRIIRVLDHLTTTTSQNSQNKPVVSNRVA